MTLGQAIMKFAKEKGMSKYRVAKNSGIPQATFTDIANGKNNNPTIDTVSKIACGLDISVAELIKEAEKTNENVSE